ncbi:VOC family protein [Swaminathania salitolerans]|uniref:Glyoxalase n=1 Tax=Swaminathania salitolerans TaxID=182838 RepID=A0A511BQ64_9PROT|nr:VOC family protein [Swaminathania salitolerans]GBQ11413.1 lactoylglutathione lyase [Swaminathania salitolerans LMG 21291]GEL02469.1 glyoxalase [Swaminathania salitolerans]
MTEMMLITFYVSDVARSVLFYSRLLGRAPQCETVNYASFGVSSSLSLGLWGQGDVVPAFEPGPGASEAGFVVAQDDAVDRAFAHWKEMNVHILQPPTRLGFGYSLTGCDPDGHRLRVFCPTSP